jgi:hypothetical protein
MASIAVSLVFVGGFALGWMLRPELGFHGATGRCKEVFVRRLALGLTLAVAAVVAPWEIHLRNSLEKFLKSIVQHADGSSNRAIAAFDGPLFHRSGGVPGGLGTCPLD